MSADDAATVTTAGWAARARVAVSAAGRPWRGWGRLFRSELWLIFGRRRNWVGLAVLAVVPVLLGIAARISAPSGGGGNTFIDNITSSGIFVALAALALEMPLFLPIAVAAISGDAIAGEANLGTLRYLLAVPAGRTRLITVKYAAILVFVAAATALIAAVGTVVGLVAFGAGPAVTLSGSTLGFPAALWRLLLISAYIAVCIGALGAIGLFVSTLTEQPIGATIATLILAMASQILDVVPQFAWLHPYLPTHFWLSFGDLWRDPIPYQRLGPGLGSALAYAVIFGSAAWARFNSRDVTS